MKRKIIASLAIISFIALAFVGCGQQSSPPPPPPPPPPQAQAPAHRHRQQHQRQPPVSPPSR